MSWLREASYPPAGTSIAVRGKSNHRRFDELSAGGLVTRNSRRRSLKDKSTRDAENAQLLVESILSEQCYVGC